MKKNILIILVFVTQLGFTQNYSPFIVVDQFGYLPNMAKIAMLRNPQTGYDAELVYVPGNSIALVNALNNEQVFSAAPTPWKNGNTDASSGDKVWHFDFSSCTEIGSYYVIDVENNTRSFEFMISPTVYNEVLKHAVRTFFYQRAGHEKAAQYAGSEWADGASHVGKLQDKNCRLFSSKGDASTERDVSGGWYDAGDYNKYTNWTADYVVEMMLAYLETPDAWADNYNIPESGNGIPDLIDEAKWGSDYLLKLQLDDGSMISIVGLSHASPPSSAKGQSLYGSPNTSGTLTSAAAFAISSKVFRSLGMETYADTLQEAAINAWNWADENPNVIFKNNDSTYGSSGLGAGQQETDDYGRMTKKLRAAAYLFEITGHQKYKSYFESNYLNVNMFQWNFSFPFQGSNQDMVLYYSSLPDVTKSVASNIKQVYKNTMINGDENFKAIDNIKDPYLAHIKDYTWGSNSIKCIQANMFYNMITHQIDESKLSNALAASAEYIHYIHGRNPFNMTYLSNMYLYGAENCVNEFYHSWFCDGSPKWDRVGKSLYGPAPGFVPGGPNPSYNWDGCCPDGCGSASNSKKCFSESIEPPTKQPDQKSYKDFNANWPLNSWSVTENSCGYQLAYIRLLSKFANIAYDCNGDKNGQAIIDVCGRCTGGNTGKQPETDSTKCEGNIDENSINLKYMLNINIFPNPVAKELNVQLSQTGTSLSIFDVKGVLCYQTCLDNSNTINLSSLLPGMYFLKIETDEGTYSQNMIKL